MMETEKMMMTGMPSQSIPTSPEKFINVDIYDAGEGILIKTFTATWCNPCKRIKGPMEEMLKPFNKVWSHSMDKRCYNREIHPYVPFVQITKLREGNIGEIQTSDPDKLRAFLLEKNIQIKNS